MKKITSIAIAVLCFFAMQNIALANDKGNSGIDVEGLNEIVYSILPEGSMGAEIVKVASERIGDPYSIEKRGIKSYLDCSGLTQWAYEQVGIEIPSSAAQQAQYAFENNKIISEENALPGDLIFWSYPKKARVADRFMQIGHVAVYTGEGMMIESAPSANGVVHREVSVQGTPIFYARLYV